MSIKILHVREWILLKKIGTVTGRTNIPYFSSTWALKNIFGYSGKQIRNLIKKNV